MGKFESVLIFSDIDGTYLSTACCPAPRNDEAIRYFQSEGGLFSFATGRMEKNIGYVIPALHELASFPVLLSNGAALYDVHSERFIFSEFMEADTVLPILDYACSRYSAVGLRATVPGGFLYVEDHPLVIRDLRKVCECSWKKPYTEWDHTRIFKLVFRGSVEDLAAMQKDLSECFGEIFEIILSEKGILEVQKKGISKGSAIERIRRELLEKGTPRKIVCIGDYENDLAMLCAADFAACPENALDSVKAVSDVTVCHCNDGAIADLIEYVEAHPEALV